MLLLTDRCSIDGDQRSLVSAKTPMDFDALAKVETGEKTKRLKGDKGEEKGEKRMGEVSRKKEERNVRG